MTAPPAPTVIDPFFLWTYGWANGSKSQYRDPETLARLISHSVRSSRSGCPGSASRFFDLEVHRTGDGPSVDVTPVLAHLFADGATPGPGQVVAALTMEVAA